MKIPEHIVEQIRQQSDIVDIVGEVVQLRQRGRNYIGLCPFHNEKTPSFNVSPDRGIYKCFGCGKGGNVFSFLMEYHKMSFIEAVKSLAIKTGTALPEEDEEEQSSYNRFDAVFAALRHAANYYYRILNSPEGKPAADYLRNRGFREETVKEFGLGYALETWDALLIEMRSKGFDEQTLEDAGLVIRREGGGVYDRFRGRLMFPIQNPMGKVIGFGGRIINKEDKSAKYINSPQSLVYDKSKVLYGMYQAKDALRRLEYALLVEGYADLVSLYQAGFHNVVASSGTALTRQQLQLITRYCKKLLIVYDADAAGANAALRGIELALEEGFDVSVVRLPRGEDPDSYVQTRGAQAFRGELDKALSFVDFKGEIMKEQGLLATPSGQAEAVRSLVETIAKIPDLTKRDFTIRAASMRFELNEHLLYNELKTILQKQSLKLYAKPDQPVSSEHSRQRKVETSHQEGLGDTDNRTKSPEEVVTEEYQKNRDELLAKERELMRIALRTPPSIGYMVHKLGVSADTFISQTGKRLFSIILTTAEHHRDPLQGILSGMEIDPQDAMLLSEIALRREEVSERWKSFNVQITEHEILMVRDCIARLLVRRCELEIEQVQSRLKNAGPEETLLLQRTLLDTDNRRRQLEQHGLDAG